MAMTQFREPSTSTVASRQRKRVTILGATGSIGESTLDLIGRNPEKFAIAALTANRNVERLAHLAKTYRAEAAVICEPELYGALKSALAGSGVEAAAGPDAVVEAATRPADICMAAIVGAAGLAPTFAAIMSGRTIALANKECLVSAGRIFMEAVARANATLLPVDSEHCAAFQCMAGDAEGVERLTLTASGGPFRSWSSEDMKAVTPEQALRHPNWAMGRKITIDYATLMNKGLELIEARHLFGLASDQLGIVIHAQSVVHCLVQYRDGSVLAQMSCPDMRVPIAYSLAWPERMDAPTQRLDLASVGTLTFEAPDEARFPALRVARAAMVAGDASPTVMNAANEIAVEAFLAGRIGFCSIAAAVEETIERSPNLCGSKPGSVEDVLATDRSAREQTSRILLKFAL